MVEREQVKPNSNIRNSNKPYLDKKTVLYSSPV